MKTVRISESEIISEIGESPLLDIDIGDILKIAPRKKGIITLTFEQVNLFDALMIPRSRVKSGKIEYYTNLQVTA